MRKPGKRETKIYFTFNVLIVAFFKNSKKTIENRFNQVSEYLAISPMNISLLSNAISTNRAPRDE